MPAVGTGCGRGGSGAISVGAVAGAVAEWPEGAVAIPAAGMLPSSRACTATFCSLLHRGLEHGLPLGEVLLLFGLFLGDGILDHLGLLNAGDVGRAMLPGTVRAGTIP